MSFIRSLIVGLIILGSTALVAHWQQAGLTFEGTGP
jgi:hypothetical protein